MTYQLDVLQRAQHNCGVRMSNLYTLEACSNVYAYNLETMYLSAK